MLNREQLEAAVLISDMPPQNLSDEVIKVLVASHLEAWDILDIFVEEEE